MLNSIEVSGKTEDEAISSALAQLGLERDDVQVEILERAKSGFLGLGASQAVVKISYEVRDSKEEKAESFVTGLLEHMQIKAEVEVAADENGGLNVRLSGENMGAIIGRRGETLDAIQHLTNYVVNHNSNMRVHINVDAENYRSKREESLEHLAKKMADKTIKYRRSMTLEPMNSYERHIIHTALQDYKGVSTNSIGKEPNRRVVISCERVQSAPLNGSRSD